jgi:hypothetical protein
MHVEMEDDLATAPFDIKEQFVTWLRNSLLSSYLSGFQDHLRKDLLILLSDVVETPDVFLRDDKEVNRSTRMDIPEHHKRFISVEEFSGFFTSDDFTEEALFFHGLPDVKDACSGSEPEVDHIPSNV